MVVRPVSQMAFAGTAPPQRLSGYFVPSYDVRPRRDAKRRRFRLFLFFWLPQPAAFTFVNSNGAQVGRVIGSGIKMYATGPVSSVLVCFGTINEFNSTDFPIYDIATRYRPEIGQAFCLSAR